MVRLEDRQRGEQTCRAIEHLDEHLTKVERSQDRLNARFVKAQALADRRTAAEQAAEIRAIVKEFETWVGEVQALRRELNALKNTLSGLGEVAVIHAH